MLLILITCYAIKLCTFFFGKVRFIIFDVNHHTSGASYPYPYVHIHKIFFKLPNQSWDIVAHRNLVIEDLREMDVLGVGYILGCNHL